MGGRQPGGDLGGVELDFVELHAARLDLGEVEDVVEHHQQRLARLAHDGQALALFRVQLAHGHDLGHGQHAVQRRADLVAHVGQEMRLQDVGGLGGVARVHQLVHGLAQRPVVGLELGQKAVEALGQPPELVVLAVDHPPREVAAAGHLVHGARQPVDRPGQARRQPAAGVERQARGHEEQRSAHGDEAGHQARRAFGLDGEGELAARARGRAHRDQVAAGRAGEVRAAALEAGEAAPLAVGQAGGQHLRIDPQRQHRAIDIARSALPQAFGDLLGGDGREAPMGLQEVGAFGAPLLQHEQHAGAQQHGHGGDQGDDGDTALERQAAPREAQLVPDAGGAGAFGRLVHEGLDAS